MCMLTFKDTWFDFDIFTYFGLIKLMNFHKIYFLHAQFFSNLSLGKK